MSLATVLAQNPHLKPQTEYEDCILPLHDGMRDRPLIYVAAFYTANPAQGMAEAFKVWPELISLGWVPFIPHVSFLLDVAHPNTPEFWYEYDLAILKRCDALYVCDDPLTAASTGVAREVWYAKQIGIPVFTGMSAIRGWSDNAL